MVQANQFGPVEYIFNLGVVLRDKLLENQTMDDFRTSLEPKAYATKYLDEISRKLCKELRFVRKAFFVMVFDLADHFHHSLYFLIFVQHFL